jgi:hypothetical protein
MARLPKTRPIGARLSGRGEVKADPVVVGPTEAVQRILERVLESAEDFLASDKVDPVDDAIVRTNIMVLAGHKGELLHMLHALRGEGRMRELAPCLGVVLASVLLIGSRAGISETARRKIEREVKRLGTTEARSRRKQMTQPYEQALLDAIRAEFEGQDQRSVIESNRRINRRLRDRNPRPASAKTIKKHRNKLGFR